MCNILCVYSTQNSNIYPTSTQYPEYKSRHPNTSADTQMHVQTPKYKSRLCNTEGLFLFLICIRLPTWPPNSNLANLVIYGVVIKQSTFSNINGHPKQYILADRICNSRFILDFQEHVFRTVRKIHRQWRCVLRT